MRKRGLALTMALAMALLTACSGGTAEETTVSSQETVAEESGGETAAPTQEGEKKEVDTIRIGVGSMGENFHPCKGMGIQDLRVMYNIHDRLMYQDKNGEIQPQLAESWEWIDDTTFEMKLKQGVKFHNGEDMTADDVKFSFDQGLSGELGSAVTYVIDPVESVEAVDDYTVRLHLKWPDSVLETRLSATRTVYILPKDYFNEVGGIEGYNAAPVGCGPFKVAEIMQGDRIRLERFEDYHGDKPYVKNLEFIKYGEDATRMTALLNGEVDIINDIKNDLVSNFQGDPNIKTHTTPVELFHLYIYNTEEGPTSSKLLRQAMNMAIDRQLLVDTLWGEGAYVPNGFQVESFGDMYIEDYQPVQYDPERAKELVAESGYDGSVIELQMVPNYYMNDIQAAEVCVDMWKQIGVNVQIVYTETMQSDFPGLRTWSCAIRFNDPLGAIWMQFPNQDEGSVNWQNPPAEVQEVGNIMKTSQDLEERREAARRYLEIMDDDVPATYLYIPEEIWGIRTDRNFEWDPYWTNYQESVRNLVSLEVHASLDKSSICRNLLSILGIFCCRIFLLLLV